MCIVKENKYEKFCIFTQEYSCKDIKAAKKIDLQENISFQIIKNCYAQKCFFNNIKKANKSKVKGMERYSKLPQLTFY